MSPKKHQKVISFSDFISPRVEILSQSDFKMVPKIDEKSLKIGLGAPRVPERAQSTPKGCQRDPKRVPKVPQSHEKRCKRGPRVTEKFNKYSTSSNCGVILACGSQTSFQNASGALWDLQSCAKSSKIDALRVSKIEKTVVF